MKIVVDAFGGDNAPKAVLEGCAMATQEYSIEIIVTGDEKKIRACAQQNQISLRNISIEHAPDVMPIEEDTREILKKYQNSSMAVGLNLLAQGKGDAFVSAGSTGALVMGSSLIVKRIKGIRRAALGTVVPCQDGCYLLVDAGANAECRPEMLVQFAIMGSAYMNGIQKIDSPRVGLVNIGAEETKGLELQLASYKLLQKAPINFTGNVEARDIPFHACDVVVADGFTGNVILKLTEGLGSYFSKVLKGIFYQSIFSKFAALIVKKGINNFKKTMDYTEHGGAPLLGIAKPVIKAHGSSNGKAFKNAIRQAKICVESGMVEQIVQSIAQMKVAAQEENENTAVQPEE